MGTFTDNLNLYKPDNGETGWGDEVDANFDILDGLGGTTTGNAHIQYVRTISDDGLTRFGDNDNDGLSWRTAKADILGAYDALPDSGGTIYFADISYVDLASADAGSNRGLWLLGPNDSNYGGTIPTGWRTAKALKLIGVGSIGEQQSHSLFARLFGGGTDYAKPLFWFSGINNAIEIHNTHGIGVAALKTAMILGKDSSGSGDTNNSHFVFENVRLEIGQVAGYGPVVDDVASYWAYIRDCTFAANAEEAKTSDKRASWLIRGSTIGEGLKWFRDINFTNGGGIKHYHSSGGMNIVAQQIVLEGHATAPAAPIYWFASATSPNTSAGSVIVSSVEMADTVAGSDPAVKVHPGADASTVIVNGFAAVEGPATVTGGGLAALHAYPSPVAYGSVGFAASRVLGTHDGPKRSFTPTAVRGTNLARQDVSTWGGLGGTATVTTGKTAPDGSTAAAELSGTGALTRRVVGDAKTCAVGDWVIAGVWMRAVNSLWLASPVTFGWTHTDDTFDLGTSSSNTVTLVPPFGPTEQEWQWVWRLVEVDGAGTPAGTLVMDLRSETSRAIEYYAPFLMHIASGTYSDTEVREIAYNLTNWSNDTGVTAGEVTTLASHKFNALGGLKVGGGANISKILSATATWDPGNMAAEGDSVTTTLAVSGAAVGDPVLAGLTSLTTQQVLISAHVSAGDTVRVVLHNKTGGAIDLGSGTLRATVFKP